MNIKGKTNYDNLPISDKLKKWKEIDESFSITSSKTGFCVEVSNLGRLFPNDVDGQIVDEKLKFRKGEINDASKKQASLSGNDSGDKKLAKTSNSISIQKINEEKKDPNVRNEVLSKMEDILKKHANNFEKIKNISEEKANLEKKGKEKKAEYEQKLDKFKNDLFKKYEEAIKVKVETTESENLFSLICKYRVCNSLFKSALYCSPFLKNILSQEVDGIEKSLKEAFEQRKTLTNNIGKMIFESTEKGLKLDGNIEHCKEENRNGKKTPLNFERTNFDEFEQFKSVILYVCNEQAKKILSLKSEDNVALDNLREDIKDIVEIERKIKEKIQNLQTEYKNNKINEVVKALIPHIVGAVDNEIFDKDFIFDLDQKIDNLGSSDENLMFLQLMFRRMLENDSFLSEFCKNINDLKNEVNKRDLFAYNTLMWPYQRDNEGSCFATAVLMKLWHDKFFQFMRMIADVVKNDKLSFKKIFPNAYRTGDGQFKSTKNFGTKEDEYDKIYQKILSPFANLNCDPYAENTKLKKDLFREEVSKVFLEKFPNINEGCTRQANNNTYLNSGLFANSVIVGSQDIIWNNGKWSLNVKKGTLRKRIEKKNEALLNKKYISEEIFKSIKDKYDDLVDAIIKNINNRRESGGSAANILQMLNGNGDQYNVQTQVDIASDEECIFKADDFQKLLDKLGWVDINGEKKRAIKGQFLLGAYSFLKKEPGSEKNNLNFEKKGHGFNFFTTHVIISDMKVGEKRLIGNLNYEICQHLYVKKIDEEHVQMVRSMNIDSQFDRPAVPNIRNFRLYQNFLVDFEHETNVDK